MSYADTPKVPQRWLAYPYIPLDVLMLGAGAGGIAKGRVGCSVVASVTTGGPFFGGAVDNGYVPMDVIAITPEDRADTAMRWRLEAAGADLDSVHDMTYQPERCEHSLTPPGVEGPVKRVLCWHTLDAIAAKIDAINAGQHTDACAAALAPCGRLTTGCIPGRPVGMLYTDPLMALVPKGGTIQTNAGARAIVDPVDELAHTKQCAWLLNHHTVKNGSIAGSAGLVQALRLAVLYTRGQKGICTMSVHKSNIGPDSESVYPDGSPVIRPLKYRLQGKDDSDMRIEWLDQVAGPARLSPTLTALGSPLQRLAGPAPFITPSPAAAPRVRMLAG